MGGGMGGGTGFGMFARMTSGSGHGTILGGAIDHTFTCFCATGGPHRDLLCLVG